MAGGNVPRNLAPIFVAAGRQYGIPPAVLAGIASVESNFGQNTGPSSAGAVGLMQFLPSTAKGLGVNPYDSRSAIFGTAKLLTQDGYHQNALRAIGAYNGGAGNPQYGYANQVMAEARRVGGQLSGVAPGAGSIPATGGSGSGSTTIGTLPGLTQQVPTFNQSGFNQANQAYKLGTILNMLSSAGSGLDAGPKVDTGPSALSGLYQKGLISTMAPNPQDFQGMKTVSIAQKATLALQGMAGTGLVNVHPGAQGYVNPIPGAVLNRTDQGVDANLKPGSPIRALGDSKVVQITPWYQGQPLVLMKLLSGPQAGKYWYVAEQISPNVRPGQTVRAGQAIGTYARSGTGIELGWGSPNTPHLTLATAPGHGGYTEGQVTPEGTNFRSFLGGLH